MKKEFINAEIEVVLFDTDDVITISGGVETPPDYADKSNSAKNYVHADDEF